MKVTLTREQKIRVLNTEDVYKVMQQILLRENKIGSVTWGHVTWGQVHTVGLLFKLLLNSPLWLAHYA